MTIAIGWVVLGLALVLLLALALTRIKRSIAERFMTAQSSPLDAVCLDILNQCYAIISKNIDLTPADYSAAISKLVIDAATLSHLNTPCNPAIADMLSSILQLVWLNGQDPTAMIGSIMSNTMALAVSATLTVSDPAIQLQGIQIAVVEGVARVCNLYLDGSLSSGIGFVTVAHQVAQRFTTSPASGETPALKTALQTINNNMLSDFADPDQTMAAAKYLALLYPLITLNPPTECSGEPARLQPDDTCKCLDPWNMYLGTYIQGKCIPVMNDIGLFNLQPSGPVNIQLTPEFDPSITTYTAVPSIQGPYPTNDWVATAKFGNAFTDMATCQACTNPTSCPGCVQMRVIGPNQTYNGMVGMETDFSDNWSQVGSFTNVSPLDPLTITINATQAGSSGQYTITMPPLTTVITSLMLQDLNTAGEPLMALTPAFDPATTTYSFPIPTNSQQTLWGIVAAFGQASTPDNQCASCSGANCNGCVHTVVTGPQHTTDRMSGYGGLDGYTQIGVISSAGKSATITISANQTNHAVTYTVNLIPTA